MFLRRTAKPRYLASRSRLAEVGAIHIPRCSVQQSTTMERLTILATVFLPLTFITGFFGQNFDWLVGHITGLPRFVEFGIGGLVIPLVLLWIWLRKTRPTVPSAG
jgi:magnesium transporter